ncbi:hypothetical protein GDO86_012140 [Hymenochirus boettgeri]|uniref:VWFD domain-containing protein n=1 Tax=Hymenochirus boettgeri TaxID=247094 RepID=A0A8T2IL56_9PIPI|nr:hypothetical protein GDO86_012140 [Hymenochirus boettgeri]
MEIQINGEINVLPAVMENGKLKITQEGSNMILQTDYNLMVLYNAAGLVQVTIPGGYQNAVCGLCGDFNDEIDDDFRLPSGELTSKLEEFVEAWREYPEESNCVHICEENCDECDPMRASIFGREEACGQIILENGPFEACKDIVNATEYFTDCLIDMCDADGQSQVLCDSLQAYATACQAAGVKIKPWRTPTLCPFSCQQNSHYEVCTHTCEVSCAGITTSESCTINCFEGCECDEGYMFDGDKCVTMDQCGCVYNGRYMGVGTSVLSSDCLQSCTCANGGVVVCSANSCSDTQYCDLQNGERACYEKKGSCTLDVRANMMTFDKLHGQVPFTSIFDLASVCDLSLDTWFRLVAITQSCNTEGSFDLSSIHAYFQGVSIAITPGLEAWVHGKKVPLPAHLSDSLSVTIEEESIVLKNGDTLEVILNKSGELTINVSPELSGSMCGVCGNFNRKISDDLLRPDGKQSHNFHELIQSWRSSDFYKCSL